MSGSIASPAVPGRVARIVDVARAVAAIRRVEFCVVELTIFSIPLLAVAGSASDLGRGAVLEGAVMFFVLYAFGDMINCVADRDVDRTYKARLSSAVYRLGVRRVTALVWLEALAGAAIAAHLALTTGRWPILGLVLLGLALGWQYSVGPLRLKGRGAAHLVCLWLLLYFLPMLCASLLLVDALSATVIALAAAYATVEMGIILVNTSEDLPEDRAAGIRTTTVALGLERTLRLATGMVLVGGAAFAAVWIALFVERDVDPAGYAGIALLAGACVAAAWRLTALVAAVRRADDDERAIERVKAVGPLVPVGATIVGWAGVVCGLIALGRGGRRVMGPITSAHHSGATEAFGRHNWRELGVHLVEERMRDLFAEERRRYAPLAPASTEMLDALEAAALCGGKRIRSTLMLLAFVGAGGSIHDRRAIDAGAAIELLHTGCLVHDDVMDACATRRGITTIHANYEHLHGTEGWVGESRRFGEGVAVILGNLAFFYAMQLMIDTNDDAQRVFFEASADAGVGQYLDMKGAAQRVWAVEDPTTIARYKTGRYSVEGPLLLGAALAGELHGLAAPLRAYGGPVGEAYQLRDDLLGAFGDPTVTGKPTGHDLLQGKCTRLLAFACEERSHRRPQAKFDVLDLLGRRS